MKFSPDWMARAFALLLLAGSTAAVSAQTEEQNHEVHHPNGAQATEAAPVQQADTGEEQSGVDGMGLQGQDMGSGMMGSGMGMTPEMMQMMQQMMGQRQGQIEPGQSGPPMGMMGLGGMMRVMFAVMDADGDSALSREEFQEAHGRIFNHMDADGGDQVTLEEMQAFVRGAPMPARRMPMREATQMDHTLSESAQAFCVCLRDECGAGQAPNTDCKRSDHAARFVGVVQDAFWREGPERTEHSCSLAF